MNIPLTHPHLLSRGLVFNLRSVVTKFDLVLGAHDLLHALQWLVDIEHRRNDLCQPLPW